jgi:glycosyltransferase involved in cell wall biosynthesis
MDIYGGAELVIVKLANYLTKKGIENALLTISIAPEIVNDLNGTRVIIQQNKRSILIKVLEKILGISVINEIIALHRGIRNNLNDFDIINVHNYPAEISTFLCNKPVIWMCNEPELFLTLELKSLFHAKSIWREFLNTRSKFTLKMLFEIEKFVVRNYIKYVCVSDEFNAKRFEKIYGFKPIIINYGIDHEFFSQGDKYRAFKKLNLYDNYFIVLQVGWIQPFKNQLESIRTIEKLKDKIPNIKLILAGPEDRGYKMMLEKYIREKKLEQYVIFTSYLNREEIRDLYHACDVLLHPIKSQGGWLAPFEALCAKKPIVVSTEMTASDIIKREKIGIVTDDFAEAIWDIYINPDKYNEIAEKGQVWVMEILRWDICCD